MVVIDKRITGFKVLSKEEVETRDSVQTVKLELMGEHIKRPEILSGDTHKLKPSNSECAFYVTVNNIELDGVKYPYEIFINSKGISGTRFVTLCRILSAVFRKGGDIHFLVDELKEVHDNLGPYTSKRKYPGGKPKRFNSLEAEIGDVLELHLAALNTVPVQVVKEEVQEEGIFPANATECPSCKLKAAVILDGCLTCLDCGYSKCG